MPDKTEKDKDVVTDGWGRRVRVKHVGTVDYLKRIKKPKPAPVEPVARKQNKKPLKPFFVKKPKQVRGPSRVLIPDKLDVLVAVCLVCGRRYGFISGPDEVLGPVNKDGLPTRDCGDHKEPPA